MANYFGLKFAKWPSFSTLAFENGVEYRNMDKPVTTANDSSTSCRNMNFGPVTPDIEVWEICTFEMIQQKSAYLTEYLNYYWTDLQRFSFGRGMYGDYKTDVGFALVQGTCYGNQLIFGDFCRRQSWLSSVFAHVFWNEVHHCLADVCINSPTTCTTSCKKMVKIGLGVFQLKWGRKWKLCCDSARISRFSFIWHTGVSKRIGILQFWLQQVNWQSFLHILWKFGEIRISVPRVVGERSTAGVDNCCHA